MNNKEITAPAWVSKQRRMIAKKKMKDMAASTLAAFLFGVFVVLLGQTIVGIASGPAVHPLCHPGGSPFSDIIITSREPGEEPGLKTSSWLAQGTFNEGDD